MKKNQNILFGVIGLGRIGKIHAENLVYRFPESDVTAIADINPEVLDKMASRFHITKAVQDYRDLLRMPEIDAVVICSSTDTHAQIIEEAAASGKYIFCEKPVDLSVEKIKKVNTEVEKHGVKLMVGFNRRFDPNFLKVHEIVQSGSIGEPHVLKITSRDPSPPPEAYIRASGGIFLDMTIHDFDMARYLMNSEVTEVYAKGNVLVDTVFEKAGDWDTAMVMLTFENGAMGTIDNSRQAVYGYDQRVEVFGSAGMVTVTNNTLDSHIHFNRSGVHSALPLNFFMDRYTDSYLGEMRAFIDCMIQDTTPPVTCQDGLFAAVIGLAAMKSVKENRPVQLSEIY